MDNILRRIRNLSRISVEELNAYDLASNLLTRNDVHSQSQNNDSLNPRLNRHRSYVEGKTGGKRGQVCSVEKALFRFVVFCNYAA